MPSREKIAMPTLIDIGTLITRSPDVCGDRPRIAGSRITVQFIVIELKAGVTPQEIIEDKPYLTLAGIHAALAYYYANQEMMDAEIAGYFEECDRLEAEYGAATKI
jgi:uncharacterized protein (DUF433 family)